MPANVYGPNDNFDLLNLILSQLLLQKNKLKKNRKKVLEI